MKKMLICCGALCMTLLLFCVSAFAADPTVTVTKSDDTVEVTVNGAEITVNKKSGVEAENNYLLMVQEGTELPTSQNLYYMNVEKFSAAFEMKAYPKDGFLTEGKTYTVYLSDWSTANNGGRKAVATLNVSNTNIVLYGDVNDDKEVDDLDEMVLARYNAGWDDYGPNLKYNMNMDNSDVNMDKQVDDLDEMILSRHNAGWDGYDLPYTK